MQVCKKKKGEGNRATNIRAEYGHSLAKCSSYLYFLKLNRMLKVDSLRKYPYKSFKKRPTFKLWLDFFEDI